jgi:hypothetical protein
MTIALNPNIQTTAAGMFTIESDGLIVGTAYPDPAARFALSGGWLAATETLPMYGGIAISENVPQEQTTPPSKPDTSLGGSIVRATAAAGTADGSLTGFSVFDQNYAAVNTPQSPVPVVSNGGLVNFYRIGSGIRIALALDPALVSLEGHIISPAALLWDMTLQRITLTAGTTFAIPSTCRILAVKAARCMVPSYSSGTTFTTWNYNGAAAVVLL